MKKVKLGVMKRKLDTDDVWERAVAAEQRRCKRLNLVWNQPSDGLGWKEPFYFLGEVVELSNPHGLLVKYRVTATGRVRRMR